MCVLSDLLAKNLPARWRKTKFQLMMALIPIFTTIYLYLGLITLIWAYFPLIALILPYVPYSPYIYTVYVPIDAHCASADLRVRVYLFF